MIYYLINKPLTYKSDAAYNRVRLFKKGFDKLGVKCNIVGLEFNTSRNLLVRIIGFIRRNFLILRVLLKTGKKDVVIIYGENNFAYFYHWFSKKTNLVVELNEYPRHIRQTYLDKKLVDRWERFSKGLDFASSIITCSTYLKAFYNKYCNSVFISPLIVDVAEFDTSRYSASKPNIPGQYIAYCGSLDGNKDGVPDLIEAFAKYHKQFRDVRLVIIGGGSVNTVMSLQSKCKDLHIDKSVVFTGPIPHEDMSKWLSSAIMLTLARPNNKQAEGGIPSKVGEYLATGVPCIITNVGDLHLYLIDNLNCYISIPDSPEEFAKKLIECTQKQDKNIGIEARNVVKQFDYLNQTKNLYSYLEERYGKEIFV